MSVKAHTLHLTCERELELIGSLKQQLLTATPARKAVIECFHKH